MADYPSNLRYSVEHEWIDDGTPATVGVTSYAVEALGDVVYLELPEVGAEIEAGSVVGEIESTKSVSELYTPVSGKVVEVNETAVDDPALVNTEPFGAGWLFKIEVSGEGQLLSAEEYAQHAG
ncbi:MULTISPECIES: glycine cleavage system protein GcvH [Isoptericola]|uniref:Glycine cleavage system H protein n=1 Tax=Isoptericola sediminis TaxID=2733572 RepID=A0A849K202_9MICO|nr:MULTISPECIES: glycine cleavage system protein GcvH [Isoptericola]MDO8143702.1 glycine cleavage system protein GcvH [Isoptericola sp. 178]MDO8147599.1 glycine cleavage system protein GcvH [Isoptericola sp. b515]MDO8150098.1 glycine cleavage system protein GcvH [Isoptericola sp. b408]NNU27228.1 glycine cleavage system protein GcvH [Isoptericola sediminis]